MNPASAGQWRTLTYQGRPMLAHLQAEFEPASDGDALRMVKWVAVIYRSPNVSAHYVRGESYDSMQDAIELALSLMGDLPPLPPPETLTKLSLPDGTAVMVRFPHTTEEGDVPELTEGLESESSPVEGRPSVPTTDRSDISPTVTGSADVVNGTLDRAD